MTEREILDGLHQLGIGARNHRLVLLLPLVQVAWADSEIQAAEREHILETARAAGLMDDEGFALVMKWLTVRPSDDDLALGRDILVSLAYRERGIGADVSAPDLQRVRDLCEQVASSAGGLFGIAFTISREERIALAVIEDALQEASAAFLDQLPTPENGVLEDL
ncbi:MAG: hypothetical protein R3F61_05975 [Myxococcota bacterium]